MGEDTTSGGIVSKLIEKAGEQGFSYIVMGVVCWTMYSMITQNNENTQKELQDLREKYEDCNAYRMDLLKELIEDQNANK